MDKKRAQKFLQETTLEDFMAKKSIEEKPEVVDEFGATDMIAGFACKEVFEVQADGNIKKRILFEALQPNSKENLPEWQKEKLRELARRLESEISVDYQKHNVSEVQQSQGLREIENSPSTTEKQPQVQKTNLENNQATETAEKTKTESGEILKAQFAEYQKKNANNKSDKVMERTKVADSEQPTIQTNSSKKTRKNDGVCVIGGTQVEIKRRHQNGNTKEKTKITLSDEEFDEFQKFLTDKLTPALEKSFVSKSDKLQLDENKAGSANKIYKRNKDDVDRYYDIEDEKYYKRAKLRELGIPYDETFESEFALNKTAKYISIASIISGLVNLGTQHADIIDSLTSNINLSGALIWAGAIGYASCAFIAKKTDLKYRSALYALAQKYEESRGGFPDEFVKELTGKNEDNLPDEFELACMTKEEREALLQKASTPSALTKRQRIKLIYDKIGEYEICEQVRIQKLKKKYKYENEK